MEFVLLIRPAGRRSILRVDDGALVSNSVRQRATSLAEARAAQDYPPGAR
jgi:hypothetical protein